eukprot:s1040_g4.t5
MICVPPSIFMTDGIGGPAASRARLYFDAKSMNNQCWHPDHLASDLAIALMPVAHGLPAKMMLLSVLAQGTAAQPLGVFGNWPPNWYVNAIAMAEHLRAEHRVRDLLRALAHLLRSRNDDHYMQYVEAPMADFLPALGGDHYPTGALPILHDYVMQWGRYVEGWLFEEYMNEKGRARWFTCQRYNHKRNMPVEIAADLPVAPPGDATADWMMTVIDFVRDTRDEGHEGWVPNRLQSRMRGRADQRYRRRALLYYEEVAVVFYAPQMQGHVAPEYVIDWVTQAEGELFALLARAVVQACNEETSLMQGEVKKKWLKEGRSRDRRRHSRSTTLGATWPCFGIGELPGYDLHTGSDTKGKTRSSPSRATCTRDSAYDWKVSRVEDRPGSLGLDEAADIWSIVLGLANEEEVDEQPGIIVGEYTRNTIIETFLEYDLQDRLTLVLSFQGVMARVLRMVGSIVEDAVEEEQNRRREDSGEGEGDEAGLMQTGAPGLITTENEWSNFLLDLRYALEAMTKSARLANTKLLHKWVHWRATDSRAGKCLGHMQGRTACLGDEHEFCIGRTEAADEESERALEQCQAANEEEEEAEVQRLADQYLEDQGLLSNLSASEYRAWDAQEPPQKRPHMCTYLEVEVASGSADGPRTARVLRVPLPDEGPAMVITTQVIKEELRETQLDTNAASGPGSVETEPGLGSGQGVSLSGTSDATTVPVDTGAVPNPAVTGVGFEAGAHFQQPHLTMEYKALYADWVAGGISLDEIEGRHGRSARELLEVQRVAMEHGLDTLGEATGILDVTSSDGAAGSQASHNPAQTLATSGSPLCDAVPALPAIGKLKAAAAAELPGESQAKPEENSSSGQVSPNPAQVMQSTSGSPLLDAVPALPAIVKLKAAAAAELPGESQAKPEENSSSGQDCPVDGSSGQESYSLAASALRRTVIGALPATGNATPQSTPLSTCPSPSHSERSKKWILERLAEAGALTSLKAGPPADAWMTEPAHPDVGGGPQSSPALLPQQRSMSSATYDTKML